MSELVFLKLGGSLITDKRSAETARPALISRVGQEIAAALRARPDLRLVLGHGSGSYGHVVAAKYQVRKGHLTNWLGYAETSAAAQRLNRLVTDSLLAEGVPATALQPSASARCIDGELEHLATEPLTELLQHSLVPLMYGDVALDTVRGCTIISTEQIFVYLARALQPQRIIMVGEVAGVFTGDPQREAIVRLVPEISHANYAQVEHMLSSSFGVDVTGGMLGKVRTLYQLVCEQPTLTVHIITGRRAGLVQAVLLDPNLQEGTLLRY
jgi:isopentenyl phosphate kinase